VQILWNSAHFLASSYAKCPSLRSKNPYLSLRHQIGVLADSELSFFVDVTGFYQFEKKIERPSCCGNEHGDIDKYRYIHI